MNNKEQSFLNIFYTEDFIRLVTSEVAKQCHQAFPFKLQGRYTVVTMSVHGLNPAFPSFQSAPAFFAIIILVFHLKPSFLHIKVKPVFGLSKTQ